jgi:hypothetical protein
VERRIQEERRRKEEEEEDTRREQELQVSQTKPYLRIVSLTNQIQAWST